MLWPIVLPLKVTFSLFVGIVVVATASATVFKWKRTKTLLISTIIAILAFVPSLAEIQSVIDARRFGVFDIPDFDGIDDFRVERYLPPAARGITIDKTRMGYRARFTITQAELGPETVRGTFLVATWAAWGASGQLRRRVSFSVSSHRADGW